MAHKNTTSPVVGTVPKAKLLARVPRWVKIAVIVVLAMLVLGLTGWLVYSKFIKKTNPLAGDNVDWSHIPEQAQKINDASQLAANGNITASKAAFDVLIQQQSTPDEKSDTWQAKGNMCATYKDYQCALQSYQEAIKVNGGSSQEYIQAGNAAYLLGQKDTANGYYQQAIDILKKDSSEASKTTVTRLESIINGTNAQGGQGQ